MRGDDLLVLVRKDANDVARNDDKDLDDRPLLRRGDDDVCISRDEIRPAIAVK